MWLTCIYGWKDRQVDEEYEEDVEALWEALLEYCQVWDELLFPKSLLVLLVQLLQPLAGEHAELIVGLRQLWWGSWSVLSL